MRDLDRTIETMKPIPNAYDLTLREVQALYELSREDLFKAFKKLYYYGFELGRREERSKRKNNRR